MGKGAVRGTKRVYTFNLDNNDKEEALLIKWLETQSTTSAVKEGLKLVLSGNSTVGEVSRGQNIENTSEQTKQLLDILQTAVNTNASLISQLTLQPQIQQQTTPTEEVVEQEDVKEEDKKEKKEEELTEEQKQHANRMSDRFESDDFDPLSSI
ncbi:hypothetical protein CN514_18735 [Bacillus sp. AFS001701]|uniref:hypothetical protein n=1 Tax=Bacillus sp. AFS001701 TaxID=2033480 RepID=UPI000BF605E9|nr:hypothetical protein [Bacillus sp. AFS001701]PET53639.1 hypothetical protein CN514_18735 [Bacillus sp. AFS001701]